MKMAAVLGIALIIVGVIGLAYGGLTYTSQQSTVNVGPLVLTAKEKKTIPISSVAGGVMLAAGIILLVLGRQ